MEAPTVFGPNDFKFENGQLEPGLGDEAEAVIRARRGLTFRPDPPEKAALRAQEAVLKDKAKALTLAERELQKERQLQERELADRLAAVAEREAEVERALEGLARNEAPAKTGKGA